MIGAREVARLLGGATERTGRRRLSAWHRLYRPEDGSAPDPDVPPVDRVMVAPKPSAPPRETYLVPRGAFLRWLMTGSRAAL